MGTPALDTYISDYNFQKNVFVLDKYGDYDYLTPEYLTPRFPANNFFATSINEVGFITYNNGLGGNYALLPTSPYKNAGTDGKDIGADITAVNFATRGAVSGIWDRIVTLSPTSQSFGASGGTGVIQVTALTEGGWSAESDVDWITITSGALGLGNGEVSYSVAANGAATLRSGTLTIGEETFAVNQGGLDTARP